MGHVELTRERRGAYRILLGKPEGNISLGRTRRGRKDGIKIYYQMWATSIDWIELARERGELRAVVNTEIISVSIEYGE
jgi:subtilisin-like proprotein convertase family protein